MSTNKIKDTLTRFRDDILNGKLPYGSLLPSEKELATEMQVSRPTVAKIYNSLQKEGLLKKTPGQGTTVVFNGERKKNTFGLLLPGAGESEIFGVIHDHFLAIEKEKELKFLWDGAIANNAQVRQNTIISICERYLDEKVSGVFFAPLERTDNAELVNNQVCALFDQENIPVVLIDRDIYSFPNRSKYPVIGLDNFQAGYVMTNHLINAGCEKIYFFYRAYSANSIYKRIAGCRSACFDANISFGPKDIIVGDPGDTHLMSRLKIIPGKTGVLCANDSTAAVVMASLKQTGSLVTKDVLVAGYDDMKYGKVLEPSLTTFQQPLFEIVTSSYEMMLSRLLHQHLVAADVNLTGALIARESTKFSY
ncbi:GntR family transcriptional regulator [Adhaeribacter pallidiroseus]|uniref:HTH-type transcriptional repressor PurR n=1 Tax=Adhaeribacter pallidiroseus TaxID=2072847 RepID=A0A369QK69_9BACT|nr:GntR family transcriptional regulator [Adhaeribacter pallidiroseus]RDC62658.1 HTH-type transcriptional repressor PurR [Adhaeribacter pallidiroseus]